MGELGARWKADLLSFVARTLPQDEQAAVLGDLEEDGAGMLVSIAAVLGYSLRRELPLWLELNPWLASIAVLAPCILLLGGVSLSIADGDAIPLWFFVNNADSTLLHDPGFWSNVGAAAPGILISCVALVCWSWCCGTLIGYASRKTVQTNGLIILLFFGAIWLGWSPSTLDLQPLPLARNFPENSAVFSNLFYRVFFAPILQIVFVLIPLLSGLSGKHIKTFSRRLPMLLFWACTALSIASLIAQGCLWWQIRTWTLFPAPTLHLPSALPFASAGFLAYLIARFRSNAGRQPVS